MYLARRTLSGRGLVSLGLRDTSYIWRALHEALHVTLGVCVLRGKQDENTYCLTGECSPDVERCLTARVPVASLISCRSRGSPSQF